MILKEQNKIWSYEEYYNILDDKSYEVISGELIMVPAPDLEHQRISRKLEIKLSLHIEKNNWGEIFDAPIDVILDNQNVVQPDIVFVSKENSKMLEKRGIFGSPDMIVEIISPSSVKRDRYDKFIVYETFKIKEYWLIDPANKTIEIFILENDKYRLFCFAGTDEKAISNLIQNFEINVNELM